MTGSIYIFWLSSVAFLDMELAWAYYQCCLRDLCYIPTLDGLARAGHLQNEPGLNIAHEARLTRGGFDC